MARRKFQGVVVSDKMDKTIVIKVEKIRIHPKYKKRYKISRKFKVDDEKNEAKVGDKVMFEECRPISKEKKWRLVARIQNE